MRHRPYPYAIVPKTPLRVGCGCILYCMETRCIGCMLQLYMHLASSRLARQAIQPIQPIQLYSSLVGWCRGPAATVTSEALLQVQTLLTSEHWVRHLPMHVRVPYVAPAKHKVLLSSANPSPSSADDASPTHGAATYAPGGFSAGSETYCHVACFRAHTGLPKLGKASFCSALWCAERQRDGVYL